MQTRARFSMRRSLAPALLLTVTAACTPAAVDTPAPAETASADRVTPVRLLPGAVAGSAIGVAAGARTGRWLHETSVNFGYSDYYALPESLALGIALGTFSSATVAWLTGPRRDAPTFWRLMAGSAIGAFAGAGAAMTLAPAIDDAAPSNPFLGLAVVFTLVQGGTTALVGAGLER